MPSSHDPVMRMFHCLFIVLKIPLFSMPSSHDPVMIIFNCFENLIEILILPFLFIVFSRVSLVLAHYVLAMKSSTLLQCQPMRLSYNIRLYIIQYCTRLRGWKRGLRK
jgi:hypothetical protein